MEQKVYGLRSRFWNLRFRVSGWEFYGEVEAVTQPDKLKCYGLRATLPSLKLKGRSYFSVCLAFLQLVHGGGFRAGN